MVEAELAARKASPPSDLAENRLLNAMRLFAALAVVAGHIRTSFFRDYAMEQHNALKAVLYALTSLGNPAVMVFFALSGYWVGGSALRQIRQGRFDFWQYLFRRLVRLWIVLLPALVLTAVVDGAGMAIFPHADIYAHPDLYTALPLHIHHDPQTFLGNVLFLQDLRLSTYGYNKPLWSLSYEFWYYVAFPCGILLFYPRQRLVVRLAALGGLALAVGIGGESFVLAAPSWILGALAGGWPGALERWRARFGERLWGVAQVAMALLIVAVAAMARSNALGATLGAGLVGAVTAIALLVMARDSGRPSRLLDAVSRLSHCTYSLYTTHMPLVVLTAAVVVTAFAGRWAILSPRLALLVAILAGAYGFAWLFARFTETRTDAVRRWLAMWMGNLRARPAV